MPECELVEDLGQMVAWVVSGSSPTHRSVQCCADDVLNGVLESLAMQYVQPALQRTEAVSGRALCTDCLSHSSHKAVAVSHRLDGGESEPSVSYLDPMH